MRNPLSKLRSECRRLIEKQISRLYPNIETRDWKFTQPPDLEMGDLSSPISFQLAAMLNRRAHEIAEEIVAEIDADSSPFIASVEALKGYINFHAEIGIYAKLVLETAAEEDEEYGFLKTSTPKKVMVEHTSANPNAPLHVGNARNSILGDALAKMLRHHGHTVETHFLVNDMGPQVAMATYGWKLLDMPEPEGRQDIWVGTIYASVNVLKEIMQLKRSLREAEDAGDIKRIEEINRELSRFAAAAQELRERDANLFDALTDKIGADDDDIITQMNTEYENANPEVKKNIRKLVEYCLRGFEEILTEIGIHFDSWDYESDLVWSGAVEKVIVGLRGTPYTRYEDGALILDCEDIALKMGLKERWGLNPNYEVPFLILTRGYGTTLYATRDIAYSLWKLQRVDRVINVIGSDQILPQLQLKIALAALDKAHLADRQTHYSYEFVRLPTVKMSGRLGRYVTLSEIIDRSISLAYDEVTKRSPELSEIRRQEIAKMVGYGAVKYALLSVDPMKVVIFDWAKALNFEMNSAPFIQYSHARACNILKRAASKPKADYELLKTQHERSLIMMLARFPEIFKNAVKELKPSEICSYANTLSDRFNSFYAALPVLKANPKELAGARLMLVEAVRIVLRNAINSMGLAAPERM
jgi:arginyl-tRNA synthetase